MVEKEYPEIGWWKTEFDQDSTAPLGLTFYPSG